MPLTEAPADAVAHVYAESLIELVQDKGGRDAVEGALGALEDVLEMARADKAFGEFLSSRVISAAEREATLKKIFTGKLPAHLVEFLLVLNRKERLGHLPAIVSAP